MKKQGGGGVGAKQEDRKSAEAEGQELLVASHQSPNLSPLSRRQNPSPILQNKHMRVPAARCKRRLADPPADLGPPGNHCGARRVKPYPAFHLLDSFKLCLA